MGDTLVLEEMLTQSVRFGGVYVPARSLQTVLGRYCKSLCVWTHHEDYKVQLIGTAIPVHYHDHHLLVCTAHQLRGVDPEDVCLLYPDGSKSVTSSGVRTFNSKAGQETDAYDVAVFEFTEPLDAHRNLRSGFLNFEVVPPVVRPDHVLALVVAGFPSSDQIYDVDENNHIGFVKRNITALPDGQPEDNSLVRARFVEPLDFDPDGLSGSPVFVIQLAGAETSTYLAGMVLRAGNESFHFLKVGYIKEFLDAFLAGK